MEVKFKKRFIEDLKDLPPNIQEKVKKLVFDEIPRCKKLREIRNLKKLAFRGNYYRIRLGDYRIGFKFENNTVIFYRVLHRRRIYRYFP